MADSKILNALRARVIVPAAVLFTLTVQGSAQELPVLGQGNLSCNSWVERRSGDAIDAATMIAWVLGYMTAYNQYGADPKVDVSRGQHTEEFSKWIDNYCRKNPTHNLYSASAALIRNFRKTANP